MVAVTELRTGHEAQLTTSGWGRTDAPVDGYVHRLGARSLDMAVESDTPLEVGSKVWINMDLASGASIRPLVEITAWDAGRVTGRYVHLFPDHRRVLEQYREAFGA